MENLKRLDLAVVIIIVLMVGFHFSDGLTNSIINIKDDVDDTITEFTNIIITIIVNLESDDDTIIEIHNVEDLQNMNNDLDAHYVLMCDIDASNISNFDSIGNNTTAFTGSLDGQGYIIYNLNLTNNDLIESCEDCEIYDVGISANITIENENDYVGGIFGICESTIENCYSDDVVVNENTKDDIGVFINKIVNVEDCESNTSETIFLNQISLRYIL